MLLPHSLNDTEKKNKVSYFQKKGAASQLMSGGSKDEWSDKMVRLIHSGLQILMLRLAK